MSSEKTVVDDGRTLRNGQSGRKISSGYTPRVTTPERRGMNRSIGGLALYNLRRNFHLLMAELTIGFPFIGYKFLAAMLLLSIGRMETTLAASFLLVLAMVDFIFNLVNSFALIFVGHRVIPVCFLSWLGKHTPLTRRFDDIGEAVDTMLSFSIVALVVGVNLFPNLIALAPESKVYFLLWNTCTVANVLGAGISRLQSSFHHAKVIDRMDKRI